jgi:hypothetical protein
LTYHNQEAQSKTSAPAATGTEAVSVNLQTTSSQNGNGRSTDFLAIATELINRGLSVIPVKQRAKAPLAGALSRSKNPEQIATWAAKWPDANVGIVSDENFTILETDNEPELREKVRAITGSDIPPTLTLTSGRENRCAFIFRRTPACGDDCLEVPGMFEWRNRNQYVVAPGSIHPSGSTYRWALDTDIAEMPDSLMNAITKLDADYAGKSATSKHVSTGPAEVLKNAYLWDGNAEDLFKLDLRIGENERHYTLLSVAGFLHDGERSAEDISEILFRVRDKYCDDPASKSDYEIARLADYVLKREPFEFEPINLPQQYVIGTRVFESKEGMDKWVAENPSGFLLDYGAFLNEEIPPRDVLLTDHTTGGEVLLASSINEVIAFRGIGKSIIVHGLIGCLVNGGKFLNFESRGGLKVLLLDGELPSKQLQERCLHFIGIGPRNFLLKLAAKDKSKWFPKLSSASDQERFLSEIEAFAPDVIVLDTLSSIFRFDTNDADQWDAVNEFLVELRSKGYCVLLTHHLGKNGTQRGRTDGDDRLDVIMRLNPPNGWEPGQGLAFELSYDKVRHGARLPGFAARYEGGGWQLGRRGKERIAELRAAGKSQREIAQELGVDQSTVSRRGRRA